MGNAQLAAVASKRNLERPGFDVMEFRPDLKIK